jgi:serine/threonine-protein kinase
MEESSVLTHQLGRNRLVATLGQGGMGTIWLAVAGGLGEFRKLLVVKELRQDLTRNHRFVEMFLDEAKIAARLNHPNVVQTLEAGQEHDRYFLSMEFLDGQPFSDVLQRAVRDPQITLGVRLRILCDALAGLHYAHELRDYDGTDLQIVHRDISPHNIFVTYDGQVKVVDFGIARAADAGSFTQPGVFKGRFAYASPEQIKGQPVDRRADIFAMGVVLWEAVAVQRFAKGKPTQASLDARLAGAEPRLAQAMPDVEPLLAEICDRAMQVEPSARYGTAEELRVAVEQYLFVSGERVNAATIAAVMQSAFAAERAAMHRMIDGHLKEADLSESLVRRLRPPPPPAHASQHDPTTVADLSDLAQSSRAELSDTQQMDDWHGSLRRRGRVVWAAAAAGLAIAAVVAYALMAQRPGGVVATPPAPPAPPSAPAPAPAPAPTAADLAEAVAPAAPTSVRPTPSAAVGGAAAQPSAAPAASTTGTAPALRGGASSPRPEASTSSGERPGPTRARAETRSSLAGASRDDAAAPDTAVRIPAATPQAIAAPPEDSDSSGPGFGEDLRRLRKSDRRPLDLEDPFQ